MEIAAFLIDFILHIDKHLQAFVVAYGPWVYALLFLIVFVETGVVVMPFLPGDSLLFIVGVLCGAGLMDFSLAMVVLLVLTLVHILRCRRIALCRIAWSHNRRRRRNLLCRSGWIVYKSKIQL